ncbi:septum formation inhibitor Maf [Mycobacterium heckeshornense]|uniref:Nucleoside triphosphate pyrophosphatase n=1 Tax=Mycobacterium heckeshornense TaxID=110505 RepID=A0A2G8B8B3_9MYCO|nr:nucleoside triphosphate pyrophosphatase [Mycobacterium heckeshornense]KMV22177.1 septum formation inhibitor Maf [Mycobacterium heckeshornense]MCV7033219.1 septum formation inhibitor Maf [Mycobacterium heckeshornense]PIJ33980.1 septum formation inhibitor Maf [Mycobacterium heckeshornense]BCO37356.1 Maf-like protein [Mycobacterium heckeshornense]BCQ10233.1 Maf-like protein [Mycobacterium heckeshornense]
MTRLVLGSASPGRLKVLRQAGVEPLIRVSGVDEDALTAELGPNASPAQVVCALARAKAERVANGLHSALAADCVVIGCDSMLHIDGRLCGKPGSADEARRQWQAIGGRSGRLYTGHAVLRLVDGETDGRADEAATTTVHFGMPTPEDVAAYVDSGEPLQVAGGFTIDGLGGWFVDGVDGDPSNVIGLSLPLTRVLLQRVGVSVAALWEANPL